MDRRVPRPVPCDRREASSTWFTKVRALLAGSLVLGVGTSLTLAAWTDDEYAQGTFGTSTFGVVGSADGSNYTDHPDTGAAVLNFTVTAGAMSPGVSIYARYLVKTTDETNVSGSASLSGATVTGTGLGAYLTYGVSVLSSNAVCDATTFGTGNLIASGSGLSEPSQSLQSLAAAGASPIAYCFEVTLPQGTSNDAQGLTANAKWSITATSNS